MFGVGRERSAPPTPKHESQIGYAENSIIVESERFIDKGFSTKHQLPRLVQNELQGKIELGTCWGTIFPYNTECFFDMWWGPRPK
jgi:hypothetical protein